MTEKELLSLVKRKGWGCVSNHQKLSEDFIEKYFDKVDWGCISAYQKLSENFIEKYYNKVDWDSISTFQKLSEEFIEKYYNKVNWDCVSSFQKLSEKFIEKYSDKVNWGYISVYQKLSEEFIEKHFDKVSWYYVSIWQKLSEEFIEKYSDKVSWYFILKHQKLSENFLNKYNLQKPKDSWLYATKEEKLYFIKKSTNYEVIDDEYIIAYKSIRSDNYSVFNFQYKYEVGKKYYSHCDCSLSNKDSFGLSAWTREGALDYYNEGKFLKVKIPIAKIGAIVKGNNKIRCFELEVLEEVEW